MPTVVALGTFGLPVTTPELRGRGSDITDIIPYLPEQAPLTEW